MMKAPYASIVACLMYAMVCAKSDISQVINMVSWCMHDPGRGHWQVVKWILRYLKGVEDVGLLYEKRKRTGFVLGTLIQTT